LQGEVIQETFVVFLTASSNFGTVANDYTLVDESNMISDLQAELSIDNEWGVGFYGVTATTGVNQLTDLGTTDTELQVTYAIPTVSTPPLSLVASDGLPIGLAWNTPSSDGNSASMVIL